MNVVHATMSDIKSWLELASEVEYLFGPMADDPQFINVIFPNWKRIRTPRATKKILNL